MSVCSKRPRGGKGYRSKRRSAGLISNPPQGKRTKGSPVRQSRLKDDDDVIGLGGVGEREPTNSSTSALPWDIDLHIGGPATAAWGFRPGHKKATSFLLVLSFCILRHCEARARRDARPGHQNANDSYLAFQGSKAAPPPPGMHCRRRCQCNVGFLLCTPHALDSGHCVEPFGHRTK